MAPGSTTPTYAALRLYLDNWRWQGAPFYLRAGKAMAEKVTEIVIQFKCPPHVMFSSAPGQEPRPNTLSLCLQPDEGVHLSFGVKVPDQGMTIDSKDMMFHYDSAFKDQDIPEAYERLIQDSLEGDASLFIRRDQMEEAWRIVGPLLKLGGDLSRMKPVDYRLGTWGPEAGNRLLGPGGHVWQGLCGSDVEGHG